MKDNQQRREKLESKFHHKLNSTFELEFVEAIPKDSPIVDFMSYQIPGLDIYPLNPGNSYALEFNRPDTRAQFACFLSHLKALRTFLQTGEPKAIIMEDDVLIDINFEERIKEISKEQDEMRPFDFIVLGFFPTFDGLFRIGNDLCITQVRTVGAYGYLVVRETALKLVDKFDRPFRYHSKMTISSENIVREGSSYMTSNQQILVYPPVFIEDPDTVSNIRKDDMGTKKKVLEEYLESLNKNGHFYV